MCFSMRGRQVCLVSVLLWHFTPELAEEVSTETNLTKEDLVKKHITKEDLAENNKLFITLATKFLHWEEPQEPFKIAGPPFLSAHGV